MEWEGYGVRFLYREDTLSGTVVEVRPMRWKYICCLLLTSYLADCTNGRAYGTVLLPSVCRLSVTYVLWLNGLSYWECLEEQMGNDMRGIEWSGERWRHMTVKGHPNMFGPYLDNNGCRCRLGCNGLEHRNLFLWSNGHMTGDVTWSWKVKVLIPICLEPNISKTAVANYDIVYTERQYGWLS